MHHTVTHRCGCGSTKPPQKQGPDGPVCRMTIVPDGGVIEWQIEPGDTYERALLAHGIVPDTVLIFFRGTSLPEDKPIEEDAVEIILTCSRG